MNDSALDKAAERILIFPFDLMSHYLRCIELAKRYPQAEILFASSEKYSSFVLKAGYKTFDVERFEAVKVMECVAKFDFSWLNKADVERVFLSHLKAIRLLKPNRVIGDMSPALKMAAELTHVPYTALMNGYMSRHYSQVRALPSSHPAHNYISLFTPAIRKGIIRFAEKIAFRIVHKPFRQLRRKYRLKRVLHYLLEMEGDENLLCDEAWLFPQKALPKNYRLIGPLLYDTGEKGAVVMDILPSEKKVILVCMGSSGNWQPLSFLSSSHSASFIIITAGDVSKTIQGNHVIALEFVSLKEILPRCSLLICHGGNGTIYEGIEHRVPMLCLTSHFEQEWNVQRLEELKLAVRINDDPQGMVEDHLKKLTI